MPIKVQDSLPATSILEQENIFVMTEYFALHQNIRPLRVLILNLMPTKIVTETQLLRKLSNTPLQIEVEFLQTASYQPHNVDPSHLESFYRTFKEVKDEKYDGMIITGAPLDFVEFEDVEYWDELCEIMEWTKTHVHSTMHLCWGAYAALYYHYGIQKTKRDKKLSGIYEHTILKWTSPLFRGMDDRFFAPHSRFIDCTKEDILAVPELELLATSKEAGVSILKTTDSHKFFMTCHPEYDADTLAQEYLRDSQRGMNPDLPVNYFPDDDPTKSPIVRWRSAGQLIFSNWLNYYVYQTTPYDVRDI
ncbi:homoserine O-acetyltransferase MetA [Eubacterium oxidoreducens]|uniref:Homoserine O-acetyltransferase n=1 Tax=Eubacterium oxidoreducens TaxID=1732 RepID=A0A1G6BVW5_EUBOX|nr:homoserine O-succinyltransferase [Eubacterium oxidoreducens]SDB24697.1 homoserine O-succinyltransferase [Eubacterium oxidoreducens]